MSRNLPDQELTTEKSARIRAKLAAGARVTSIVRAAETRASRAQIFRIGEQMGLVYDDATVRMVPDQDNRFQVISRPLTADTVTSDEAEQIAALVFRGAEPEQPADFRKRDDLPCQASPDVFFPEFETATEDARTARALCARCPVRQECLDFAVTYPVIVLEGIWGGQDKDERAPLRKAHLDRLSRARRRAQQRKAAAA